MTTMFDAMLNPQLFAQAVAAGLLIYVLGELRSLRREVDRLAQNVARLEGRLCGR